MSVLGPLITKACRFLASKTPSTTITGEDGSPYLTRHYLFRRSWLPKGWGSSLPSVYLHYFHRGDADEELHNHPWRWSISLILTGGYHEERRVGDDVHSRIIRPGRFNVIRGNDFDRVDLLEPQNGAWTVFVTTNREQDWGFWHPHTKTFINWREHVEKRRQAFIRLTELQTP